MMRNTERSFWTVKPRGRGFTLMELLTVIVILGILISLLFPTLGRLRAQSRTVGCTSNLKQIYAAATAWRNRHPGLNMPANGWTASIAGDIGDKKAIYMCPEDNPEAASGSQSFNPIFNLQNGTLNLHMHIRDTGYDIPCAPGPYCKKENVTANSYELNFEDQVNNPNTDWSFRNAVIKVEDNGDGTVTVTNLERFGSYTIDLVDSTTGQIIFAALCKPGGTAGGVRSTPIGLNFGTSYAFNRQAEYLFGASGKILAMDFTGNSIVDPAVDDFSKSQFIDSAKGNYVFARHNNGANILYADGSVQFMPLSPLTRTIDPAQAPARQKFWMPNP